MERSEVDFMQLVEMLLAEWDGDGRMAAQIRRAVLKAARHVAASDPLRDALDVFTGNLDLAAAAIELGADADGWRKVLMADWQALAQKLRPTIH